ncbi:MAG: Allophanate hydrolase 2 subunit 1 (EC [uncultured Sulfurovum sp.]|uniref:Allophanate hydrolase 2 subunit 1 (EC) n=1 Tax=uncultured Sulfurovum sp. TaxID=269237 RepID=A0A6S6SDU2_9BACT|nr:MAG: Allophanate hydrolase 2 subunit 1 (EC [uncultured Sulfurovum sp.]
MTFKIVSLDSLIIYFKQEMSESILDEVQSTYLALKDISPIKDLTPSYCSILVQFDMYIHDHESMKKVILSALNNQKKRDHKLVHKLITIPTDYTNNLDLERVAHHNALSIEEVVSLHTQKTYRVYAIGFMVGFAYLASVHPKISTPRLESPRQKILKGSVALAELQTAVYPQDSAGGWNIIGQTTFDAFHTFEVGDKVQFERI